MERRVIRRIGPAGPEGTASVLMPPRELIDAAPVGAISVDGGGTVHEWNSTAERLFGWTRPEVVGHRLADVLEDERGEPFACTLHGARLNGAEMRLRTRTGHLIDVAVWSAPLGTAAEALVGYVVIVADIAERKRLEAAQTSDALRSRETFLSVASHELGGPLARLKLYTELLQLARSRNDLNDALLTRALASMQLATSRLASITQDLLDVARWQGGGLPLSPARLQFGKLVREVVRGYQEHVDRRVVLRVSPGRHMVVADASRLEQVCENLLDNAFKYSPGAGDVYVDVRSEGGGVLLEVRDRGIGIPAGSADTIFEPFERAANAERRGLPGMGLGLYICRSIVERHGGRVWAESPGEMKGTTVSVWLPGADA